MNEAIRILAVGDEPNAVDTAGDFAEDGIIVETAASASEGLVRVDSQDVDCVVSGYELQRQNGIEFLEAVRDSYPSLPFFLYAENGSEGVASDAISAGVTDYIRKDDLTASQFADRIRSVVKETHEEDGLEHQFRRVYERITDGFFAINTDWRYTYVNEEGARLVGRSKDDLLGERVWDVFPDLADTRFEDVLRTAMDSQETTSIEEYYPEDDMWYDATIYPAEHGISVYFRDVTEHKTKARQFEAIFNNTHTFVGLLQPDGTLLEANETALSFGGVDREDVVGKPLWETYWFQSNDEARSAAHKAVEQARNGEFFQEEIQVQGANRDAIIDFTVRPVTNEQGEVTLLVPEGRDITERKRYVRRLETLIDNLPGMTYRCENEPGWPMEGVRGRVEELTGYPASAFETREGLYGNELIHPDDREDVWETIQEAIDEREPFELTYRIVSRDGTTKWLWERGQRVNSTDDGATTLEGFITDITERKESTRELREEQEFVNQSLDLLDDLFYVVGTNGRLRRWNRSLPEITGYTDDEIEEMEVLEFFPEEEHERASDAIEETLTTGTAVLESELLTADGERIPYEFTGTRLTDPEGELVGLVGIGRDISEQKRRERELEQQREHLAALNNLHEVVRDVTDAVIEQPSRESIERITCEKLATADSYAFAWIADAESGTQERIPHIEAGVDAYLESTVGSDAEPRPPGHKLAKRTIQTRDVRISRNGLAGVEIDSRRKGANDDSGSLATVPIVHEETLYGVIGIYSERTDAFAREEREVLAQLGEIVGYALYALERKEVLGSALELEFQSEQIAETFREHGGGDSSLSLDAVVSLDEEKRIHYWTIQGMKPRTFQAAVESLSPIASARLLSTSGETARFEMSVRPNSISSIFASFDGEMQSIRLEGDAFTFVGEFPETVDVDALIRVLRETYTDVEFVSQRRILTPKYLRQMVDETLTDRQKMVLQTAYFGEYFGHPRLSTGEELADNLGITKQTFHHHLRNAEEAVFRLLFEEPSDPLI